MTGATDRRASVDSACVSGSRTSPDQSNGAFAIKQVFLRLEFNMVYNQLNEFSLNQYL